VFGSNKTKCPKQGSQNRLWSSFCPNYCYVETCLNRISLGPAFVDRNRQEFGYTGKMNKDFLSWDFYLIFALYRILVKSVFGVDRFHWCRQVSLFFFMPLLKGNSAFVRHNIFRLKFYPVERI